MSRLQAVGIPFTGGVNDGISSKLLPNGVLADVRNGRLHAAGSLRLRRGWRPVAMGRVGSSTPLTAFDLYSYQDSLVALTNTFGGFRLATLTEANATRPWVLDENAAISPLADVRTVGNSPPLAANVVRASAAVTAGGVYGAVLQQSTAQTTLRVFEMATDETIFYDDFANGGRERKVVCCGSVFGILEDTGSALTFSTLDPTATTPAVTAVATLVTATIDWWDVGVTTETTPTALHVVTLVAGAVDYRQFTLAGVQTGLAKAVVGAGAEACAVASDGTAVHVVYQTAATHELSLLTFSATSPYTTSAGPTAVDSGEPGLIGAFAVGCGDVGGFIYVALGRGAGGINDTEESSISLINQNHSASILQEHLGERLVAGLLARDSSGGAGFSRRGTVYYTQAQDAPWGILDVGIGSLTTPTPPFAPGIDPTGNTVLIITPRDETPGTAVTPRYATAHSATILRQARRPGVQLGNALYISGAMLTQWVGDTTENGMLAPQINALVQSNSTGTIANGTYSYRAIMVWQDQKGRTHRSPVSPVTASSNITTTGANDTVTATVYAPKTYRRSTDLITNPRIELYRTEAGPGELFYLVGSATVSTTNDATTVVDLLPDASIVSQPQLYTQGEFGATSGILEQAPARPSSVLGATKRRLVLGSADASYQWSQVTLPDLPVFFAELGTSGDVAQVYYDEVEGRITGVGTLDELVYVGTRERVYVTGGTGPNLAGIGEFIPPARVPANVGFESQASILETHEGLWFQAANRDFYLQRRGVAAPEPDQSVQDRLSGTIVGAGYESGDNTAIWATSAALSLVRQLEDGQWFTDGLPFTPIALVGHQGVLYAIASDGVVWRYETASFGDGSSGATAVALRVTTGDIEPMQLAGFGRVGTIEVDAEYQTDATILCEISYDSGLTWNSLGSHTITGLAAGALVQRQWIPLIQRTSRFRLRFTMTPSSTTAEGCRLTGCMVYLKKRSGPTRVPSTARR